LSIPNYAYQDSFVCYYLDILSFKAAGKVLHCVALYNYIFS
jgi:hypothetical protein